MLSDCFCLKTEGIKWFQRWQTSLRENSSWIDSRLSILIRHKSGRVLMLGLILWRKGICFHKRIHTDADNALENLGRSWETPKIYDRDAWAKSRSGWQKYQQRSRLIICIVGPILHFAMLGGRYHCAYAFGCIPDIILSKEAKICQNNKVNPDQIVLIAYALI